MAGEYIEKPGDVFYYDTDWKQIALDNQPGGGNFTTEAQEDTLVGYIPYNKIRSAMRYFLGYAYCDMAEPYLLHRENPSPHPMYPWLYCHSFHVTGMAVEANYENEGFEPYVESPFFDSGAETLSYTNYQQAVVQIGYRALRYRNLPDAAISSYEDEWMRSCFIEPETQLDVLTADGIGQLKFAEDASPNGPVAGTGGERPVFPAPVPTFLAKGNYTIHWYGVPFNYLSDDPDVFHPAKILAGYGLVNSADFIVGDADPVFPAGTALMKGMKAEVFPWPVAPGDPTRPLLGVNVHIMIERFDPPLGATSPIGRGHNNMPWRGKPTDPTGGKFFWATRGGETGDPPFLGNYDFNTFFEHVLA